MAERPHSERSRVRPWHLPFGFSGGAKAISASHTDRRINLLVGNHRVENQRGYATGVNFHSPGGGERPLLESAFSEERRARLEAQSSEQAQGCITFTTTL